MPACLPACLPESTSPLAPFPTHPTPQVLHRPEGAAGGPVRGTVAKVEEGPHPERPTYLVALPGEPLCVVLDGTESKKYYALGVG